MKKLVLFMATVMAAMTLCANPVDMATAQRKAKSYLANQVYAGKVMAPAALNPVLIKAEPSSVKAAEPVYYIFNTATTFVVVSGDDRAEEVLMVGDAPLNLNRIPDAMKYMLNGYKEEIEFLQKNPSLKVDPIVSPQNTPSMRAAGVYGPLLTCNWDQMTPYNNQCKFTYNGRSYTCMTGCPATSAAMVLYFWKFPKNAVPALPSYQETLELSTNKRVYNYTYPSLPSTTFDWDNMKNSYMSYNSTQANAVATLMRYVGQAEHMIYGTSAAGGSGISIYDNQNIVDMFTLFGYDPNTCRVVYKTYYNDANWATLIQNEIMNGRPIVYTGSDASQGGHAYNVDGYNSNTNKYHVNFGWSGDGNNWFAMSAFSYGGATFNLYQQAIIGIQPLGGGEPTLLIEPDSLDFTTSVGTPITKTFTVKGYNLTSNVTLSCDNSNYTISPTKISPTDAVAGVEVSVTFNPSEDGTHDGTITLSNPAVTKTVPLTGKASAEPFVTATPGALSYSTPVGTAVRKTFILRGFNLLGSVYLSVSGEGFTISKTTITKNTATNGSTVIVTYNPTEMGHHTGLITITTSGAQTLTVPLEGEALDNTPVLTVNPTSLTFEAGVGQTVEERFTVSGANLTGSLSLSLQDENGAYSLNKTSITSAQALAGAVVVVSYNPATAGSHLATITLSGGGVDPVTINLSGEAVMLFARGDVNHDGEIDVDDVTSLISIILGGDTGEVYLDCADVNDDGGIDVDDVTALITMIMG